MKSILVIMFSFLYFIACSQSIENCGIDNNAYLNSQESQFLNNYLEDSLNGFNLKGKKIIFVTGNSGHKIKTKNDYFKNIKERMTYSEEPIATRLIILTEKEKEKSGGYDAIITYWMKILTKKRKKKLIKQVS